jgi:acetylornithine/succinyldiaminopimelate/putrescine aminotransferase
MKVYDDDHLYDNAAKLGPVLLREVQAIRDVVGGFARGLGLLAALELEAPLDRWKVLGGELAKRKLSLHVDAKRGTAIFAPPLCITEQELVTGMRSFGEAAKVAFGS